MAGHVAQTVSNGRACTLPAWCRIARFALGARLLFATRPHAQRLATPDAPAIVGAPASRHRAGPDAATPRPRTPAARTVAGIVTARQQLSLLSPRTRPPR